MTEELIINSEAEYRKHIPANVALDYNVIETFLPIAQHEWIEPVVGTALLEDILSKRSDALILDETHLQLQNYMQAPLAYIVSIEAIPHLNVNARAGGFTVNVSDGASVASKWRVNELKDSLGKMAQRALDKLVEFLDTNRDSFTDYKGSEQEKSRFANFINTSKDWNKSVQMRLGAWMLDHIRPTMSLVEERVIPGIICDELYADLKEKIADRSNLGDYAPLLPLIQPVVANYTAVELIGLGTINIESDGVYVKWSDGDDALSQKRAANDNERSTAGLNFERQGAQAIELLKKELVKNIDKYPLYAESSCYTAGVSRKIEASQNGGIFPGLGVR
jgi:hypothetical protein